MKVLNLKQNREELLFQLTLIKPVEQCGSALVLPLRDNLQRLALSRFWFG